MSIWAPVARRLVAAGHRVVLYDQRGHGDSTLGRDALTIDRLGNDLAELLRQLDITDAVVGGHSMGGMTIQASAAASPSVFSERVRAVALVSTAAHTGLLRVPRRLAHALIGDRRTDQLARRPLASGRRMVGEQVHEAHLRAARDAMLAVSGAARADCMVAMGQMDYRDTLPTIEVPVRILVGTRDALTPVVRARELVEGVPDGRLRVLDGLGHMLPLEAPDTVAATIIELADPAAAPSVDPAA